MNAFYLQKEAEVCPGPLMFSSTPDKKNGFALPAGRWYSIAHPPPSLLQLKIRLKTLLDKKKVLQARHDISGHSYKFTTLEEGFQQFAADLNKLQQFVEINGTAFSKILKKWDKSSKSRTKELYLSRAVEVQPFFNAPVISELSDQATTSLQELGAWADGIRDSIQPTAHVAAAAVDKRPDIGDTDTILLDTAISGNLDSLREFLLKMKVASDARSGHRSFRERITRTFLSAIHSAPRDSLQLLLESGQVDLHSFDDINERNCLHQAAIYGKQYVLEWGLGAGVAVSRTDIYGRVPLHYAGLHGRLDMLNALLAGEWFSTKAHFAHWLILPCSGPPNRRSHRSRQLHSPHTRHHARQA